MATPFNIISNVPAMPVPAPDAHPRPDWLRVKFFGGERFQDLKRIIRTLDLHTVCESARCPNMGECWEHGTATFMILGDICTRACGFCAVPSGKPVGPPDEDEPFRVAEAVAKLGLRYAVVTSVNRDDQPDGGAHIFARTIEEIRRRVPGCKVEVLIPDFRGDWNALDVVLATRWTSFLLCGRIFSITIRKPCRACTGWCAKARCMSARWSCCAVPRKRIRKFLRRPA